MALTTVAEASAVNTVTSHLLGRHADGCGGRPLPTDEEVLAALRVLVRASYGRLSAGWSPQQLEEVLAALYSPTRAEPAAARRGVVSSPQQSCVIAERLVDAGKFRVPECPSARAMPSAWVADSLGDGR